MNKEYINKISDKELREYVSLEMQKNVNYRLTNQMNQNIL